MRAVAEALDEREGPSAAGPDLDEDHRPQALDRDHAAAQHVEIMTLGVHLEHRHRRLVLGELRIEGADVDVNARLVAAGQVVADVVACRESRHAWLGPTCEAVNRCQRPDVVQLDPALARCARLGSRLEGLDPGAPPPGDHRVEADIRANVDEQVARTEEVEHEQRVVALGQAGARDHRRGAAPARSEEQRSLGATDHDRAADGAPPHLPCPEPQQDPDGPAALDPPVEHERAVTERPKQRRSCAGSSPDRYLATGMPDPRRTVRRVNSLRRVGRHRADLSALASRPADAVVALAPRQRSSPAAARYRTNSRPWMLGRSTVTRNSLLRPKL